MIATPDFHVLLPFHPHQWSCIQTGGASRHKAWGFAVVKRTSQDAP